MSDERAAARADAAAAKARAKAMRPWYRKKRFMIPLVLVVLIGIAAIAGGGGGDDDKGTNVNTGGVASGSKNETNPPQDDVTISKCEVDPLLKLPKASGTIVNHSSKPSNYIVHLEFNQGATRVAEGYEAANEVAAGQTVNWDATGDKQVTSGAVTCKTISVERYASRG